MNESSLPHWIKDSVQNFKNVTERDRHLKKAEEYKSQNIVDIIGLETTIRMNQYISIY